MPKVIIKKVPTAKGGAAFSPEKAKKILREKNPTLQGHPITAKQKRWLGWQAGGAKAEDGASVTPIADNVVQFGGNSHENGGIPINYGGKNVEVEGGETAYKSPIDDSLHVMGNMINPLTNRKFKEDSKRIAEKERKVNKLLDTAVQLVNKKDPYDKWEQLSFNAGRVMMEGSLMKKGELSQNKEWLATLQKTMLEHANELGADPQEFSKGNLTKAKNGYYIKKAQGGDHIPGWDFRGTRTQGLDEKILGFLPLLEQHGLTGYSGPESGISQRNTKSGRLSRHAQKQALDAFINQPDAYQKVLNNPDLTKYLIDNGLTIINEYDPNVAKQTGATAGHLHIGYDQGTPVSDQFRKDASRMYKSTNPEWGWSTVMKPKGKAIQAGPTGDQQYFPVVIKKSPLPKFNAPNIQNSPAPAPKTVPNYDLSITEPTPFTKPTNASKFQLGQILPELYTAATNKPEPVWMQKYQPQLYQPYVVSFQDKLNENQATFNALQRAQGNNAAALSTLAGQKYAADTGVLGEQFRTNQGIEQDIVNKNISLLNDAQLKNLSLADTQYTRQAQTKSNVRMQNQVVLESIADKLRQHQLENRTLQVYENLYPNFSFDQNYRTQYSGPNMSEYINYGDSTDSGNQSSDMMVRKTYDATGKLKQTVTRQDSAVKDAIDRERLNQMGLQTLQQRTKTFRALSPNQRAKALNIGYPFLTK